MAVLKKHGGVYRIDFRFNGKRFRRTVKAKDKPAAENAVHRADGVLRPLELAGRSEIRRSRIEDLDFVVKRISAALFNEIRYYILSNEFACLERRRALAASLGKGGKCAAPFLAMR